MSKEEMRAEKILSKQTSQSSQDRDKTAVEEGEKVSIIIHKSVKSSLSGDLKTKFQLLRDASPVPADQSQNPKPLIQKVPFTLRDNKNFEKYYEPRAVSIGPLHHDNPKFKQSEKLKIRLAALFIKENCPGLYEELYEKIMAEIDSLRKCYYEEETASYNDESLAWMLFVDGCAVLQYLDYAANGKLKKLELKNDHMAFAGQDLFLLENQLPYKVLKILMSSSTSNRAEELKKSISDFIGIIIADIRGCKLTGSLIEQAPAEDTTHLLELLWKGLVGETKQIRTEERQELTEPPTEQEPAKATSHLLELLRKCLVKETKPITTGQEPEHQWYSFRNVNELKERGIKLKSHKKGFFKDISFISHWFTGTLTLPSIVVDDSTAPRFLNLIAYEMCPDFCNDFPITSYIFFLDSLIDQPDDVKELRNRQILHNLLGSDEEVAKLFNEIGTDLVPNSAVYSKVRKDIQNHYRKKWKTWIAQWLHEHFSSPWTFLAFAGAILALVLSIIQTFYTIHPASN